MCRRYKQRYKFINLNYNTDCCEINLFNTLIIKDPQIVKWV